MPDVEILPILVAAVAAFVLGGGYYAVLGAQLATASDASSEEQMPPWKLGLEFLRGLVLAAVRPARRSRPRPRGPGAPE